MIIGLFVTVGEQDGEKKDILDFKEKKFQDAVGIIHQQMEMHAKMMVLMNKEFVEHVLCYGM